MGATPEPSEVAKVTVADPTEELRWLHYGERLRRERRSLELDPPGTSPGALLWRQALAGGAQALGQAIGGLAPGREADFIVLDESHPVLIGRRGDVALDSLVFAAARSAVRDVMVGGRWVVRGGRHGEDERITDAYRRVAAELARA